MTYNPTNTYNPRNWYWNIGGVIYSSAAEAVIAEPNVAYDAWKVANTASPMDTWANLDTILANYNLGPTGMAVATAAQLQQAANKLVRALLSANRSYTISGISGSIVAQASGQTQADLIEANIWGATNPSGTMPWTDDALNVFTLTGVEAIQLAGAVGAYKQSVYAVLPTVLAGIANGSITTLAQIKSAAWPS